MHKQWFSCRWLRCWAASLLMLAAGCELMPAADLAEFGADFARSALAAWLF